MRDWELVDSDRFSFEDSDRFEEDSLCSWISEPESLCNNWRGWKKSNFPNSNSNSILNGASTSAAAAAAAGSGTGTGGNGSSSSSGKKKDLQSEASHLNLVELTARCVASHIPFEMVERFYPPVPEQLQLRIAFWSFPEYEEDIRLYSCLANGSAEEFSKGEKLFKSDSVSDTLQIGFHLSATVRPNIREAHKVAITFDRRRITSCTCTCNASTNWCGHVVSVCLHRIFLSKDVTLRAPVSESLSRLQRDQLQKFAQYLISELPQQILPTAQRLLDELLSSQRSAINTLRGAPDPTAGASANEQTSWYLDERTLHGNIHKILIKFCVPAPIVFSDVNYLTSAAPPASAEWSSLLRPLRGREPEGMWNLLSIVREMFRREDRNAVPLLEIITEECLNCDQILVWWFNTKVALHNGNSGHSGKHHSVNSNAHACQHAGSSLCDEIVLLWRLAALNPGLSPDERCILHNQFKEWHMKIIEKISKSRNASVNMKHANSFKNDVEVFPGFRPSLEACYLTWDNYRIPGITYSESSEVYHCPFMCFRHSDGVSRSGETGQIHSSHAVLNNPVGEHHLLHSSATISSSALTKRPRSVDFGGNGNGPSAAAAPSEPQPGTSKSTSSSSAHAAGPSKGKSSGKNSKKNSHAHSHNQPNKSSTTVLEDMINSVCLSASGLKIKSPSVAPREKTLSEKEQSVSVSELSSFEDDVLLPACPSTPGTSTSASTNGQLSSSSVSSSRSRIFDEPQAGSSRQHLAQRQLSIDGNRSSISSEGFCENEPEPDTEASINDKDADEGVDVEIGPELNISKPISDPEDFCDDSDSSISASRLREVDLQSLANIQPDINNLSSDSQQSGDEYQLYYYDPKASSSGNNGNKKSDDKKDALGVNVFTNLKRIEGEWDVLFARAEGLHAHGHAQEACKLGVKLAEELLANPPDLSLDLPHPTTGKGKRKKINPISHQISCLASGTLAKCGFLCTVLAENSDYYYLAFCVGMFGLELSRPPASTKPLEVKLANQEAELAQWLKRIPLGSRELEMIRNKAEALKNGTLKSRGEALLPLVLANFIFDALVVPAKGETRCTLQSGVYHLASDEILGFEAAVAALGFKANVSEADHPLLCEGTRRQRGDLALAMLLHYKDEPEKLSRIMDKLLDREIHQLCKVPLPAAYYSNNPPTTTLLNSVTSNKAEENEPQPAQAQAVGAGMGAHNFAGVPANGNDQIALSAAASTSNGSNETSPIRPLSTTSAEGDPAAAAAASGTSNVVITSNTAPPNSAPGRNPVKESGSGSSGRFKGKRAYPVLPNQPSEAGAHFMFELGKVVLSRAGGSSNQSLFTQPSNGTNPRGPHRALHMCAFHIGLYALGLHNAVSPNWLSRTYSSHVSWITGQAMEIGAPAIVFLIDTWDSHLTPPEAVTIADRASRGDVNMVRAAAELALSCLPHASALNPNELHRAILQCKEQSDSMLEKACTIVETAAKGGGVCPEVLFDVARQWFSLYQKHLPMDVDLLNDEFGVHDSLLVDPTLDPMNPGGSLHQQQMISVQTGLPVLNPNNPPLPTPSHTHNNNSTPPLQQQGMENVGGGGAAMRLPPQDNRPQPPPQYPQQINVNVPYGAGFQPQFIPAANFNPMPMTMYPQLIYQPNGPNLPPMNSGYYAHAQPHPSAGQQGPIYSPPTQMHQHSQHPHHAAAASLMSAGPALQYYAHAPASSNSHSHTIQVPISSSNGNPVMRQPTHAFFPLAPMGLHHHGSSQIPTPSHPHLAVMAATAAPGGGNHGHPHGHGHLVALQHPPVQSGQPLMLQPGGPQVSGNGNGQQHGYQVQQAHAMSMNRGNGQPQMMNQHFNYQQLGAHGNPNGMPDQMNGMPRNPMCARDSLKQSYLVATYRVGMLAMESLARSRDDRPTAKFSRNPLHGEDIKWVLSISKRLSDRHVQQFCICAMQSITNPFTLHEIVLDAASYYNRAHHLSGVYQNPRYPVAPLVQKCQQMYFQCLHQKLYHITAAEYDDFVSIVCTARQAFHLTPDGISQFKEWLQNLRRSKACKKDLLAQISQALQANGK